MIVLKQIRYLILAALMVSLPTQPMGWFSKANTWFSNNHTKVLVVAGTGLCASIGYLIWEAYKLAKEYAKLERLLKLPVDVPIDKKNPIFIKHVNKKLLEEIKNGRVEHIDFLIKWGGDINVRANSTLPLTLFPTITYETTPAIMAAARNGHVAMVKKLLELGALTTHGDALEKREYVILNDECRKLLANYRKKISKHVQDATPLPADIADITAQYLSPQVISLDDQIEFLRTHAPLLSAAQQGDIERIKFLLDEDNEGSIKIDAQNKDGITALLSAISSNKPVAARFLIEQGANVNIPDNAFGMTPLLAEINRLTSHVPPGGTLNGSITELLYPLLDKHADISHKTKYGLTAYDCARGNQEIVNLLNEYRQSQQPHPLSLDATS